MITVKFFGVMSIDNNIRKLEVREGTVKDVLAEVSGCCPGLTPKQLKQAIMVINKNRVSGHKRMSIVLKAGDELVLLNPPSGG